MEDGGWHDRGEIVDVPEVHGGAGEDEQHAECGRLGEGVHPRERVGEAYDADGGEEHERGAGEGENLAPTRWTGRPGYPIRALVGMALAKSLYVLPTWTRTVRLVADHAALRKVIGGAPSVDACYRFTRKLREHSAALDSCFAYVLASPLRRTARFRGARHHRRVGPSVLRQQSAVRLQPRPRAQAVHRPRRHLGPPFRYLDSQGRRVYGYKVHAAVCTRTGLPVAWETRTARDTEVPVVPALLDKLADYGIAPTVAVADRGYDVAPFYGECEGRGIRPVVPLRETPVVRAGKAAPPSCEHGAWTFAGADAKRGAAKYRCSSGECSPASVWIKTDRLHTLIPRETDRWKALYRSRGAGEREFGILKHQ